MEATANKDRQGFAGNAGLVFESSAALTKQVCCRDVVGIAADASLHSSVAALVTSCAAEGGVSNLGVGRQLRQMAANIQREPCIERAGDIALFLRYCACCVQMNGVKYCLEALGPWGAAAAAHLDLLSAVPDSAGDGEEDSPAAVPEEGQDDAEAPAAAGDAGELLHQTPV